jgi:hypothetical protein
MNIIEEQFVREHTENSCGTTYIVYDPEVANSSNEDVLVRIFALGQIPQTIQISNQTLPLRRYHQVNIAGGAWRITVRWELINWSLQFEITGNNQHITQSKETIAAYNGTNKSAATTDYKGGINCDKSGPHGCEIYVPSGQWSETYEIPVGDLDVSYELAVKALKKTPVNNASFRGRDKGEVLFMGMNGALSSVDPRYYTMTFRFGEEHNVTDLSVSGIDGTITKEGWQYLWYAYDEQLASSGKQATYQPTAAYVERVYDYGDFSVLNIGTTRENAGWQG